MITDFLSKRALRCDCVVVSTMINWFMLVAASSLLCSAGNPIIENVSREPFADQNNSSIKEVSAKDGCSSRK